MSLDSVLMHVTGTSLDPDVYWRMGDLTAMSLTTPPDAMLARNQVVLKADAHALWFRWFIQGVCNPLRYVEDRSKTMVDIVTDTVARVNTLYQDEPEAKREELARGIARHVFAEVERRRDIGRVNATTREKKDLVDTASGKPRCWVCGFLFSKAAIDRFFKRTGSSSLVQPRLVDIFRPRGLQTRDICIEVEHIVPVAAGGKGQQNLALSCGWCNKSKGALTSLYDADARAAMSSFKTRTTRWHELPNPFWTVRLIALRGTCEFPGPGKCTATNKTHELFIAPINPHGSPNPSNLRVYCSNHDPYTKERFLGRAVAGQIWSQRRRQR